MKSFRTDFTKVRVSPPPLQPPWRRYETTWDDIMTEIGDEKILKSLNEPTRHEIVDERLDNLEKRLTENITLAIRNQSLVKRLSENQTELFKLMERSFGAPDRL